MEAKIKRRLAPRFLLPNTIICMNSTYVVLALVLAKYVLIMTHKIKQEGSSIGQSIMSFKSMIHAYCTYIATIFTIYSSCQSANN